MRNNIFDAEASGLKIMERLKFAILSQTLAANLTLSGDDTPTLMLLDPGGASRDVILPPEAVGNCYVIFNTADAVEDLVVKDDSGTTTYVTISQNEAAIIFCVGAGSATGVGTHVHMLDSTAAT